MNTAIKELKGISEKITELKKTSQAVNPKAVQAGNLDAEMKVLNNKIAVFEPKPTAFTKTTAVVSNVLSSAISSGSSLSKKAVSVGSSFMNKTSSLFGFMMKGNEAAVAATASLTAPIVPTAATI